ncbi:MAG: recombinase family protein, partial [Myxococcota bacterium]
MVRLDRAARSVAHLARLAERVPLVASDQPFDQTTAAGRMVLGMLAVIAAFESDLIRERTLDGLAVARDRGLRLGPPRGTRVPPAKLARARALRAEGVSWRDVARQTGVSVGAPALRAGKPEERAGEGVVPRDARRHRGRLPRAQ